jgi:hypothetical protein
VLEDVFEGFAVVSQSLNAFIFIVSTRSTYVLDAHRDGS